MLSQSLSLGVEAPFQKLILGIGHALCYRVHDSKKYFPGPSHSFQSNFIQSTWVPSVKGSGSEAAIILNRLFLTPQVSLRAEQYPYSICQSSHALDFEI